MLTKRGLLKLLRFKKQYINYLLLKFFNINKSNYQYTR